MAKPRLLGISGSLRRDSFSTVILRTLQKALMPATELVLHPLNDVPLYNQDEDTQTPPDSVRALRQAIANSDGLILVSPEYSYGMPGVMKNALDWASRPYGAS